MLNIKVHDSTIRKRLNKHGLFVRIARRKQLLTPTNINERKKRCKEEQAEIPPQQCE